MSLFMLDTRLVQVQIQGMRDALSLVDEARAALATSIRETATWLGRANPHSIPQAQLAQVRDIPNETCSLAPWPKTLRGYHYQVHAFQERIRGVLSFSCSLRSLICHPSVGQFYTLCPMSLS